MQTPEQCEYLVQYVRKLEQQVDALKSNRDVVDKLPHTADGEPVVPGMIIWPREFIDGEEGARIKIIAVDIMTGDTLEHGTEGLRIGKCFSTRQAALEA